MKKHLLLCGFLVIGIAVSARSLSYSPPEKATLSVLVIDAPSLEAVVIGLTDMPKALKFDQPAEIVNVSYFAEVQNFNDTHLERSERWRRMRNYTLTGIYQSSDKLSKHLKLGSYKLC